MVSDNGTQAPGPRRRGRPQAGEDFRRVLLDAAAIVYADCGYHGTTVEKVLLASGVSRPTFYRYFRDKDMLLTAVVEETNARLIQDLFLRLAPVEDRFQLLEEAISVYFDWGLSVGKLARVLWGEIHMPESPVGRHRQQLIDLVLAFFQEQAKRHGRPVVDPLLYEGLIAVIESVASKGFLRESRDAEDIRRRKAVILRIFLSALAKPDEWQLVPELPLLVVEPISS